MTVAALFIDRRGPYPARTPHAYDVERNAKTYVGPWPVVAHPPCGPWGRLRHLSRYDDPTCAPWAVHAVQFWGGVLEHPRNSLLWAHCNLPKPGEGVDRFGGYSLEVNQCDFGHVARKATWLYVVRGRVPALPEPREPTHWISGGRGRVGQKAKTTPVPPGIKVCSAKQRLITPPAFADFLIAIAESVVPRD